VKPVFRRKSIGTKVSEEEYAKLETLAGGRALSEWVREVLLREVNGRQARRSADRSAISERVAQGKSNQFNGLDFLLPWFGTRRSVVQIHRPESSPATALGPPLSGCVMVGAR
jgi:hypothetical protein